MAYILVAVSDRLALLCLSRNVCLETDGQALLSFSSAFLVRSFAPYAAGSGISEIKCILGGFIIKGFLSAETFIVKCLTMVRSTAQATIIALTDSPLLSDPACLWGKKAPRFMLRVVLGTLPRGCSNGMTGAIVSLGEATACRPVTCDG